MSYPENGNLSVTSVLTKKDWERIYRDYYNTWKGICKTYGVRETDAGDFIHKAFLNTEEKAQLGKFTYKSDIETSGYIARAIKNLILNGQNEKRPEPLDQNPEYLNLPQDELSPLQKIIRDEDLKEEMKLSKRLKEALKQQLNNREQRVIDLRFYHGMKFREIAAETGWPIPTIQKLLNAAIKKLGNAITAGKHKNG